MATEQAKNQQAKFDRALINPQEGDLITIQFERSKEGQWFATSDQFPGLLVAEHDFVRACHQIGTVITRLFTFIRAQLPADGAGGERP